MGAAGADSPDRTLAGEDVAANPKTLSQCSTMWMATSTGRLFITANADAEPDTAATFTRIDTSTLAPNRFVSGIAFDPANANHAWISYSGYSRTTLSTPRHVFEVNYDPKTQTATFVDRSRNLADLPISDVAYDPVTGDLYASSDFGVYRVRGGFTQWNLAASGMPNVGFVADNRAGSPRAVRGSPRAGSLGVEAEVG